MALETGGGLATQSTIIEVIRPILFRESLLIVNDIGASSPPSKNITGLTEGSLQYQSIEVTRSLIEQGSPCLACGAIEP
jgi:hypothetical protein